MGVLFGTDGIRGVANEWPITAEVALRLGRAVARVLNEQNPGSHEVVIGKDTRLSGYMLETALISGLVSEGVKVLLAGALPTPAVAYLTKSMGCDAGIMLTASHNPFMDNGIKLFGNDGYKFGDALEEEMESLILADKLKVRDENVLGEAQVIDDANARYIEFAKSAVGETSLKGLKVVVDCANGAACSVGPTIFKELGAEVIERNVTPDGRNINEGCGALHPKETAEVVLREGADLGICFDGDADRVIFVDGNGKVISGDRVLCLCAIALKEEGKLVGDTLVATVMSNLGLRDALKKHGVSLELTGVGDRLVIECMREQGFSFGGENSGHLIFSDCATTGDGIVSGLQVLSMMKRTGKTMAELADCMDEYPQELHALSVKDKPPIEEVPDLIAAIDGAEQRLGDDGRVLVRYSGTEKKIRVLVEAKDADIARCEAEAICNAVRGTIGS